MLERSQIIHENFLTNVAKQHFPIAKSSTNHLLDHQSLLSIFDSQLTSRHIDLQARQLKQQGKGFYTIASCGHEGNAAIAYVFKVTDCAFLHYRSSAFMLQRSLQKPDSFDPIKAQLLSLVAAASDPCSAGRHKVFGSAELTVPPQISTIASHLPKAVGTALSITRAKELHLKGKLKEDSVVLCSFGDATTHHSTARGAFNAASWIAHEKYPLPLVFICEDNGWGISVKTPSDWISQQFSHLPNIHYIYADGLNMDDVVAAAKEAEDLARNKKQPVFLHMQCVRLLGHAGSDIETLYRTEQDINETEFNDPLLHSARMIIEKNILTSQQIIDRYQAIQHKVSTLAAEIANQKPLQTLQEIQSSIIPKPCKNHFAKHVDESTRKQVFAEQYDLLTQPRTLAQQINLALMDLMLAYDNLLIFGEDVAKKGGVYHITAGLMQRFGQRRVFDTILDEQTILGTAIGLAHNGFVPIPEIQFLAYLHNAEDQLRGEAATLSFFSNQQFDNPMVVRIASFAYQKGFGGHFHNDNSFAVLRDIPGIIIATPSNGDDAAKMLRECVRLAEQERRIVVFLEPIALYPVKDLHEVGDNAWLSAYSSPNQSIALGELGIHGSSDQLTIISYANGYYLSRQAAKIIEDKYRISVRVVDCRWLAPLNEKGLLQAVAGCKSILIVDECRKTGSISEALMTLFVEQLNPLPKIKRVTAADCFIPLGSAAEKVLPSRDDIVKAAELLI